ncbi:MAG: nitronate monooxygenase [Caryophanon sp.]|nr:nitronate monooxygenase [Caryophanon sp.]
MLHIDKQVIQAPMAGITTPAFVAACSNAGILGSVGAGYLNGPQTRDFIQAVKQQTTKPFQVNLFIQEEPRIDINVLQQAKQALLPIYEQLNVNHVQRVTSTEIFSQQIDIVIEEQVPIVSFTFGLPHADVLNRLFEAGIIVIGTATTVAEAKLVEQAGCQYVVAQGKEAGGHRGSFNEQNEFHATRDLVRAMKEVITIPIIAAGGIIDARDVADLTADGADYMQVGSAFLITDECQTADIVKQEIKNLTHNNTVYTKAFSGKMARGVKNEFVEYMEGKIVAPYPLQNDLTKAIRAAATIQKRPEFLSVWVGERGYLCEATTIEEVLVRLGV